MAEEQHGKVISVEDSPSKSPKVTAVKKEHTQQVFRLLSTSNVAFDLDDSPAKPNSPTRNVEEHAEDDDDIDLQRALEEEMDKLSENANVDDQHETAPHNSQEEHEENQDELGCDDDTDK